MKKVDLIEDIKAAVQVKVEVEVKIRGLKFG
jgi:tRNA-dihydrouridine synthase